MTLAWSSVSIWSQGVATRCVFFCTAGWLEFNIPFQQKYDYIRDECSFTQSQHCVGTTDLSTWQNITALQTEVNIIITKAGRQQLILDGHHVTGVVYLLAVMQHDGVVTAAKQSMRLGRKQAILFHFECVEIVIDITHSAAGRHYQVNAWQTDHVTSSKTSLTHALKLLNYVTIILRQLVGWSLMSLSCTNTAISETISCILRNAS